LSDSPTVINRFALIGDVHGEDGALAATLDFLRGVGPLEAILCTGDLPGKMGVGDTNRCAELLRAAGARTIRGNHDAWAVENEEARTLLGLGDEWPLTPETVAFLDDLPRVRTWETPLGPLLLCHGVGEDFMAGVYPGGDDEEIRRALKEKRIYGKYRLMVAGHTHKRMVRPLGTLTAVNPGTLLWDGPPGFAVADVTDNDVQFYDLTPFTNQIKVGERFALFPDDTHEKSRGGE
jgi:predicted phosphodiesterase